MGKSEHIHILLVEDDPDDRILIKEAFQESGPFKDLHFVKDGEELMDYLHRRGEFNDPGTAPRPSLILLDLNMPKKDGREALVEIKSNPEFRNIPVVVLTTSNVDDDIRSSYRNGASSYITKPATFGSLVDVIQCLSNYWFEIVKLPPPKDPTLS
jgi:CheY-like chemotaxis protein